MGCVSVRIPASRSRLTLLSARATSAAPMWVKYVLHGCMTNLDRFFPPVDLSTGPVRDGGLTHNCPIDIALSEQEHIWSDAPLDMVISLGTGTTRESLSESREPNLSPWIEWLLKPLRCITDLVGVYMDSIDGQSAYERVVGRRKDKRNFFRMNIRMDQTPEIDDISSMDELSDRVYSQSSLSGKQLDVLFALLAKSFYFELDSLPVFDRDYYRCEGTIRCRNNSYGVLKALNALYPKSNHQFANDLGSLSVLNAEDICTWCQRYSKAVVFYVRRPSDDIKIFLQRAPLQKREISSFPKPLDWFVKQQRLDASFGVADHHGPGLFFCRGCDEKRLQGRKRQVAQSWWPPEKRVRLS